MASNEYNIEWKRSATKELRQLPREVVARILRAVEELRHKLFPAGVSKLSGAEHTYRIREGSYRVIYSVYASRLIIEVIRVGHRRDVYKK
ncbi:MAG TPA: type II toxin-antitoxin system RelE/ParE family toxin [Pyrinomonadaceae bacterium]|nr:type II toxin-antitoxin system RelE/ParE family toxin [Pyrinomonadaceae bacterium]